MLFHILWYDIWFYISHIMLHRFYILHQIHHTQPYETLTWRNTMDGHLIETPLQSMGLFVPLLYDTSLEPLILAFLFVTVRGLMRHDHRCSWLIGNHHLLHHRYRNSNFGEYWIDYVCGTTAPKEYYIHGILYT